MARRAAVHEGLERFGRAAGLEKHSGRWYRRTDETVAVSELQKSEYGPQYYFNQAFWLLCVGDTDYPLERLCHVRFRLGALTGDRKSIDDLLDLEVEMDDEERAERIKEVLSRYLLPVIERGGTVEGLRAMVEDGTLDESLIHRDAMGPLGVTPAVG